MGKIFYLIGKSSSGKDTVFKKLKEKFPQFRTVTLYTTRPMRQGEKDGREYFFVTDEKSKQIQDAGKMIELREYHTVHGIWKYFTADDGQICLEESDYLMIGTLEAYEKMCNYFGKEKIVPLYIEVEDGERLFRALERERQQKNPKYAELCRRFLADNEDFSEEKLKQCQISKRFENRNLEICLNEIMLYIQTKI